MEEIEKVKEKSREIEEEVEEAKEERKESKKKEIKKYFFTAIILEPRREELEKLRKIKTRIPERIPLKIAFSQFEAIILKPDLLITKRLLPVATKVPQKRPPSFTFTKFHAAILKKPLLSMRFREISLRVPEQVPLKLSFTSFDCVLFQRLDLKEDFKEVSVKMENVEREMSLEEVKGKGLLESLLEISEENSSGKRLPRAPSEAGGRPIVVLLQDHAHKFSFAVIHCLHELLREVCQRRPSVTCRGTENEEDIDGIRLEENLRTFKLSERLEIIDLLGELPEESLESFFYSVYGRLKKAYTESFGILLLISENVEEILKEAEEVAKYSDRRIVFEGLPRYVFTPEEEDLRAYVFALLGVEEREFFKALRIRDIALERVYRRYSMFVKGQYSEEELVDTEQYKWKVATFYAILKGIAREQGRDLKKYSKELLSWIFRLISGNVEGIKIDFEERLEPGVIPDMVVNYGNTRYVEVETLIGTKEPMKKIDETIDKYFRNVERLGRDEAEIWIVVRPESALLHYKELKLRERFWNDIGEMPIRFKVLILDESKDWETIGLKEYYEKVRELREKGGRRRGWREMEEKLKTPRS